MNYLVMDSSYLSVCQILLAEPVLAIDTETFGLNFYDDMFCFVIANANHVWYFDIRQFKYANLAEILFNKYQGIWCGVNIKFDMHKLRHKGYKLKNVCEIILLARNIYNRDMKYGMDALCLKYLDRRKNDEVTTYIRKHKLKSTDMFGETKPRYDLVPHDLMFKYACDDARNTYDLYQKLSAMLPNPERICIANDHKLINTVHEMEYIGVSIDEPYCDVARKTELLRAKECEQLLSDTTGTIFRNGPKWLRSAFDKAGITYELTEKGNLKADAKTMQKYNNEITSTILDMRGHTAYANTFYQGLLKAAAGQGVVHCSYNVGGTDTFRFSSSDPNLQNLPKENTSDYNRGVRGAIRPRIGYFLAGFDYDQMEYRLMADYAGEKAMIAAILRGLDPHTYVANLLGVSRKIGKTLNFGLLYGMGITKLAAALKITVYEAKILKNKYMHLMPKVAKMFKDIDYIAKGRGFLKNRYDRHLHLDDPNYAYQLVNHLIQSTGADTVRIAMVRLHDMLTLGGYRTRMILQVHDELVFEMAYGEEHLIIEIKKILETVYTPFNGMVLTSGCKVSEKDWGSMQDYEEGILTGENNYERAT